METLILIIANAVVMLCVLCAWRLSKEHTRRIKQLESSLLATQEQLDTLAGFTERIQKIVMGDVK